MLERTMRVYLHIGMHKTGTTSLQRVLLTENERLKNLGYRIFLNPLEMNAKKPSNFNPAWIRSQINEAEVAGLKANCLLRRNDINI